MIDADEQFSSYYENGRRAARVGLPLAANPHLEHAASDVSAWVEGYHSVDLSVLSSADRFRIFDEGQEAASRGEPASASPYLDDENPELLDIWLLGYAPHV